MKKKDRVNKIFFLLLLFEAGRNVNTLQFFGIYPEIFLGVFTAIYFLLNNISIDIVFEKKLFNIILLWIVYFIISGLFVGEFSPVFFIRVILYLVIGYALLKQMGIKNIIDYYIKVVYYLSIVSLFFFTWQTLNLNSFLTFANLVGSGDGSGNIGLYIYNFHRTIERNAGFAWEPGPFACYVSIALFFNLLKNDLKFDKRSIIFVISIFTTQSATGGVLLILILSYVMFNKGKNKVVRYVSVIFITVFAVFSYIQIEFISNKISYEYETTYNLDNFLIGARYAYKPLGISRFNLLTMNITDIKERPILGYAGNDDLSWVKEGNYMSINGGIGALIARYGSIMFLLWSFLVYNAGRNIISLYGKYEYKSIWLLMIFVILFAFSTVGLNTFMFVFYMYGLNNKANYENQNTI